MMASLDVTSWTGRDACKLLKVGKSLASTEGNTCKQCLTRVGRVRVLRTVAHSEMYCRCLSTGNSLSPGHFFQVHLSWQTMLRRFGSVGSKYSCVGRTQVAHCLLEKRRELCTVEFQHCVCVLTSIRGKFEVPEGLRQDVVCQWGFHLTVRRLTRAGHERVLKESEQSTKRRIAARSSESIKFIFILWMERLSNRMSIKRKVLRKVSTRITWAQ